MRRGTTPVISLKLSGLPEEEIVKAVLSIRQGELLIDKKVLIEQGTASALLSQEETLSLSPGRDVLIQVKVLTEDGNVLATKIINAPVEDILNEEVMNNADGS